MSIYDKSEIIDALNKNVNAFNQFVLLLNKEQFENTYNGKWSAGQNLYHLMLCFLSYYYIPFIILEAGWTLVSLIALLRCIIKAVNRL